MREHHSCINRSDFKITNEYCWQIDSPSSIRQKYIFLLTAEKCKKKNKKNNIESTGLAAVLSYFIPSLPLFFFLGGGGSQVHLNIDRNPNMFKCCKGQSSSSPSGNLKVTCNQLYFLKILNKMLVLLKFEVWKNLIIIWVLMQLSNIIHRSLFFFDYFMPPPPLLKKRGILFCTCRSVCSTNDVCSISFDPLLKSCQT